MKLFLASMGLLGGLGWILLRFFPPTCVPITEETEVFCNRLWSPALLGMLLGFIGLYLAMRTTLTPTLSVIFIALPSGLLLMLLGNLVEYWLLNQLPHEGPAGFPRGLAWMTVLGGLLLVLLASALAGFVGLKFKVLPVWLCTLLTLLFPLTISLGLINLDLAGLPLGLVGIGVGSLGIMVGDTPPLPK